MFQRKIATYFLWICIVLSAIGGLNTITNMFSSGKAEAKAPVMDKEAEVLALQFAKEWLTIYKGENLDHRVQRIQPFLDLDKITDWESPSKSQTPKDLYVARIEQLRSTYWVYTIEAVVEQKGMVLTSSKRTILNVPIEMLDSGKYVIGGEPSLLPAYKYEKGTPVTGAIAPEEVIQTATPFLETFIKGYYQLENKIALTQMLANDSVEVEPIGQYVSFKQIADLKIFVADSKKREYIAVLVTTVKDPSTGAIFSEKSTIYFTQDDKGKYSITKFGRY